MILTSEISPHPALAPFIRCYALRDFDTGGTNMTKPYHASHEITLIFFFKALPVQLKSRDNAKIVKRGTYCDIMGLGTQYNGEMTLYGRYLFLEINFKPGGLYKICNVSAIEFLNRIISAEDLFGPGIKFIYEQLCQTDNLVDMADLLNVFFLKQLKKQKSIYSKDVIVHISNQILRHAGVIDIARLAYETNMSIRTLERYFTAQTGMSPKLFCCIARFNRALSIKLGNPRISWTSVAQLSGYFDQMHLVREFKRFSGNAPSAFIKETPLTEVEYASKVNWPV